MAMHDRWTLNTVKEVEEERKCIYTLYICRGGWGRGSAWHVHDSPHGAVNLIHHP